MIPTKEAWSQLQPLAAMQNINLRGAGARAGRGWGAGPMHAALVRRAPRPSLVCPRPRPCCKPLGFLHPRRPGDNVTATFMSGGLALYWFSRGSGLDPARLPLDGPPARVDTEVRPARRRWPPPAVSGPALLETPCGSGLLRAPCVGSCAPRGLAASPHDYHHRRSPPPPPRRPRARPPGTLALLTAGEGRQRGLRYDPEPAPLGRVCGARWQRAGGGRCQAARPGRAADGHVPGPSRVQGVGRGACSRVAQRRSSSLLL
jgi:hypothetical protein